MRRIISPLLFACFVLASAAPDNNKAAVQAVIVEHYNRPFAAHKRQLTEPPKDGQTPSNDIMYCMKPVANHIITRNDEAACYVLYTGFAYDMEQKIEQDAHASSDLVELFVLEKTDDKWAVKQHGRDETGAQGDVPENKTWKFVQADAQNWGYIVKSSYIGQGDTVTLQNFLFTDDSNHIRKSFTTDGNDNSTYFDDCDELRGCEKRDCKDRYTGMEAKIVFDKSRPAVSDVWALTAKFSGASEKKNHKNQKYIFLYNGKTHVAPRNYPLGGQQFPQKTL